MQFWTKLVLIQFYFFIFKSHLEFSEVCKKQQKVNYLKIFNCTDFCFCFLFLGCGESHWTHRRSRKGTS